MRMGSRTSTAVVIVFLLIVLAVSPWSFPATEAQGRWNESKNLSTSLNAAALLDAPTGLTCTENNGLLAGSVKIAWNAVPNATSYRVLARATKTGTPDTFELISDTNTTNFNISTSLLSGLGNLLNSLLLGRNLEVVVESKVGEEWTSLPSQSIIVYPTITIIPLSLSALKCR